MYLGTEEGAYDAQLAHLLAVEGEHFLEREGARDVAVEDEDGLGPIGEYLLPELVEAARRAQLGLLVQVAVSHA